MCCSKTWHCNYNSRFKFENSCRTSAGRAITFSFWLNKNWWDCLLICSCENSLVNLKWIKTRKIWHEKCSKLASFHFFFHVNDRYSILCQAPKVFISWVCLVPISKGLSYVSFAWHRIIRWDIPSHHWNRSQLQTTRASIS